MKILQINSVCGVGSTGRIASDLYRVLLGAQHACRIAYGRGRAPAGVEAVRIGSDLDACLHAAYTRLTDKHGFASRAATQAFLGNVAEYRPDVIHLHNIHGYYINVELLFAYLKQARTPVVWTLHDCWSFTGHCCYFDYAACSRWQTGCHDCPQQRAYPQSLWADNSAWNYQRKKSLFTALERLTLVTPSNWLAGLVRQSFLADVPVQVINNGIDLGVFKPTASQLREAYGWRDKFVVLGVASGWDRRKGWDYFLDLAGKLGDACQVVLVGVSAEQKKRLPATVCGIEKTDSTAALAELYSAADVFVNPTLEDNFPTTNLEALACGTPVVTFQTGGSVECLDASCGLTVPRGDAAALAHSLNTLRGRNLRREDCVRRAKQYDKNERYRDYAALYETILQ